MDTPTKDKRYIISQDNKQTVRGMRFYGLFEGLYEFKMGEAIPYSKNVRLDFIGYGMMISPEAWESDTFPFEIVKVFEVDIHKVPIGSQEPSVYYVPDREQADE